LYEHIAHRTVAQQAICTMQSPSSSPPFWSPGEERRAVNERRLCQSRDTTGSRSRFIRRQGIEDKLCGRLPVGVLTVLWSSWVRSANCWSWQNVRGTCRSRMRRYFSLFWIIYARWWRYVLFALKGAW